MEHEIVWRDRKRVWCGLPWTFTKYELSREKLIIKTGFFTQNQDEVRLYRILDLSLKRSLMQRMFGLGTIQCHSVDKTMKNFEIKNIKNSEHVKNQLSDLIEEARRTNRVSSREFMTEQEDEDEEGGEV
ncbi:MAG: PH domain-containing protein [Lachnospiraceae bacterium]|nr:PH domain-containing protein [Lachnospiraceae bacterium]MDD7178939.1 PH domain-containing protein [bacterium]MDY5516369.1 PH domain-containing protein [Lachnospiraceae bacterium]